MSRWIKPLGPFAVAFVLGTMPHPDGLPQHAWYFFAIFTGVVFALVVEPLPAPAIGLIGVTIVAASAPWTLFGPAEISARGFDAPGRAVQWALSGFNNSTVWLAFSAFMFGTAYERTGLGRRIALSLVKTMGRRTLFLGYAVMLSDLLIAPFTPSNTARSAGTIFPVIRSIPPLYGSQPDDPSARMVGGYILWTGFATSCITSSLFLTALAPNFLAVEFARNIGNVEIHPLTWTLAFLPAGLPLLMALPVLVYVLYPPTLKYSAEVPAWAAHELSRMHPISPRECAVAALVVVAVALWIFAGSYIHATTAALVIVSIMLLVGVITWEDIISSRDAWRTLIYLATLVTLADGLSRTGFIGWFAETVAGSMSVFSPNQIIIGFVCVYFFSHYMFASLTAHATAMLPVLLTLGSTMPGVPFDELALMLGLSQGLMGVLTPYATGPAPVYANSGYIPTAAFWRLGTIFGAIFLGALLLFSGPFVLSR